MEIGYQGKTIGEELKDLLSQVLDEKLPNQREALMAAAEKAFKRKKTD